MGLDMYPICNCRLLTKKVFARRVRWGYEPTDSFHGSVDCVCSKS